MECSFKEVHQCYIYILCEHLPYHNTMMFKCIIEFVKAYQITTSLGRTGILFQDKAADNFVIIVFDMHH